MASGNGDGTFTMPLIFPLSPLPVSEFPADTEGETVGIGVEPLPFFDVGTQVLAPVGIPEMPLVISPAPTVPMGPMLMFGR